MGEEKKQGAWATFFKGAARTYGRKVMFGLLLVLMAYLAFLDIVHVAENKDPNKSLELFYTVLEWIGGIVVTGNISEHVSKGFGGKDKVTPPKDEAPA